MRIVSSCSLYFLLSHILLIFNLGFPFTDSSFRPPITYSLSNAMGFPHSVQLLCIICITGNHFSFNPFPLWVSMSLNCFTPVSLTPQACFLHRHCFPSYVITLYQAGLSCLFPHTPMMIHWLWQWQLLNPSIFSHWQVIVLARLGVLILRRLSWWTSSYMIPLDPMLQI